MDEALPTAVTAIRDTRQEGFIAGSLIRSGSRVIYRATTHLGLQNFLESNPSVLLIASEDFPKIGEISWSRLLILDSENPPLTDFELSESIRQFSNSQSERKLHIPATSSRLISISSLGGRSSATTTAISLASLFSQAGKSTLLVDANFVNPRLAQYFDLHKITDCVAEASFGFTLFEVRNIEGLSYLSSIADSYDYVILDCGNEIERYRAGRRVADLLHLWVEHSRAFKITTARDDFRTPSEIVGRLPQNFHLLLLQLSKSAGKRERNKLKEDLKLPEGIELAFLSRDLTATRRAEIERSTVIDCAPRSHLSEEMSAVKEVILRACAHM